MQCDICDEDHPQGVLERGLCPACCDLADPDEIVWTTRDGRALRAEDLTDSHLRNVIAMLERQESAMWSYVPGGEAAEYAWESQHAQLEDKLAEMRGLLAARLSPTNRIA